MINKSIFNQFTKQYSLSKTLRFSLEPIDKTLQEIKKQGFLKKDTQRAAAYGSAKKIVDVFHQEFINGVLADFKFCMEDLYKYMQCYEAYKENRQDKNTRKALQDCQKKLRRALCENFKKNGVEEILKSGKFLQTLIGEKFKPIKGYNFLSDKLTTWRDNYQQLLQKRHTTKNIENPKAIIRNFAKWDTYFSVFDENRRNIYSNEAKATSIAYRLIHENLPRFIENMKRFQSVLTLLSQTDYKLIDEIQ
ncbi:MAG: hypothetical protein AAGA27_06715, partial [Pseudomonadota bacterium]